VAQEAKLFEISSFAANGTATRMTVLSTAGYARGNISVNRLLEQSLTTCSKTTNQKLGFNQINQTF